MKRIVKCFTRAGREEGSALIAALGVSMVGILFAVLAVSVAISVTNDSGRDRIRTTEIHAAESIVDTVALTLETTKPCTVADQVVGGGATAVNVRTTIEYFGASGAMTTCSAGQISGTPTRAIITSVATPTRNVEGLVPVRTMKAVVNIKPVVVATAGSAIFSGSGFTGGAGVTISSADPNVKARVWIDSGDYMCNTSVVVNGDVVVAQGKVTQDNASCTINGDVWAKTGYASCCTPSATYAVAGNLTVRAGNLTLSNKSKFGGNISVSGTIPTGTQWTQTTVKGSVCYGSTAPNKCTSFTEYAPMGFPQINYVPGDWASMGFTSIKTPADFGAAFIASWTSALQWQKDSINANPCNPGNFYLTPVTLPQTGSTNTIYNLTSCAFGTGGGGLLTLDLKADVVIFAKGFSAGNGLKVTASDGLNHKLYLIVPYNTPTPGTISYSTGLQVVSPAAVFLYTPKGITFPNTSTFRGQMYGSPVTVQAGSGQFFFVPVPTPGGYLGAGGSATTAFTVELVSKSED